MPAINVIGDANIALKGPLGIRFSARNNQAHPTSSTPGWVECRLRGGAELGRRAGRSGHEITASKG
jgi:hypothetical protein